MSKKRHTKVMNAHRYCSFDLFLSTIPSGFCLMSMEQIHAQNP